ncbi:hypothetical protein FK004_12290 [Flavobacterium kingsejongi]|uniref:Uncharacterized protein n=1 Tax=Flavobacterium kingsejongi TaxID=1678728 RepID=A0A2S1LQM5_9FLAO|nr:hypothetical protein FK004_12290 [Flavobacterium kingsejongi]
MTLSVIWSNVKLRSKFLIRYYIALIEEMDAANSELFFVLTPEKKSYLFFVSYSFKRILFLQFGNFGVKKSPEAIRG